MTEAICPLITITQHRLLRQPLVLPHVVEGIKRGRGPRPPRRRSGAESLCRLIAQQAVEGAEQQRAALLTGFHAGGSRQGVN